MDNKGMRSPDWTQTQPHKISVPEPEIPGKTGSGKEKARPVMEGRTGSAQKRFHTEKSVPSDIYPDLEESYGRDDPAHDFPAVEPNGL